MITKLENHQWFVFGSNLAGRHGKGAALFAKEEFGAQDGVGEGLTGRCYALPTLDGNLQKRREEALLASIHKFYACALGSPSTEFLLTKVGCGLAGYDEDFMVGLFRATGIVPQNVTLPQDWAWIRAENKLQIFGEKS